MNWFFTNKPLSVKTRLDLSPDELRDASRRAQQPAGCLHAPDDPPPRERRQHGKVTICY